MVHRLGGGGRRVRRRAAGAWPPAKPYTPPAAALWRRARRCDVVRAVPSCRASPAAVHTPGTRGPVVSTLFLATSYLSAARERLRTRTSGRGDSRTATWQSVAKGGGWMVRRLSPTRG